MSALPSPLSDRLRRHADSCDEEAWRVEGMARNWLHIAARDARVASRGRFLPEWELRHCLDKTEALAKAARLYGVDPAAYVPDRPVFEPVQPQEAAEPPPNLLTPVELAPLFDMTERGARKAIETGYHRGLPGFYCETRGARRHWYATREAFAQRRAVP